MGKLRLGKFFSTPARQKFGKITHNTRVSAQSASYLFDMVFKLQGIVNYYPKKLSAGDIFYLRVSYTYTHSWYRYFLLEWTMKEVLSMFKDSLLAQSQFSTFIISQFTSAKRLGKLLPFIKTVVSSAK